MDTKQTFRPGQPVNVTRLSGVHVYTVVDPDPYGDGRFVIVLAPADVWKDGVRTVMLLPHLVHESHVAAIVH